MMKKSKKISKSLENVSGEKFTSEIAIQIRDSVGIKRIQTGIDNPKIKFLNSEGEVIYSLLP